MGFVKGILAAAAVAMSAAPIAASASDIRPGNSVVSASAAAASPMPLQRRATGQRTGAALNDESQFMAVTTVLLLVGGTMVVTLIWVWVDEPESP